MLVLSAVILVETSLHVEGEQRLLEEDMRDRHHAVGVVVREQVQRSWARDGEYAAIALLANQTHTNPTMRWRLIDVHDADTPLPATLAAHPQWVERVKRGEEVLWQKIDAPDSSELTWASYLPLDVPGEPRRALECVEQAKTQDTRLQDEMTRALWVGATVLLCSLVLSLVLGYFLVGRPVSALLDRFEQVKAGDLSPLKPSKRTDELGHLETAFEELVSHLHTTRQELEREQEARSRVTAQLRQTDRLRAIGTLAAGIAHELGTPLHVIDGRANMIRSAPDEPAKVERHAGIVIEQCARVQATMHQLLNLSRREPNNARLVSLANLCRRVVALLDPHAQQRGVDLDFRDDSEGATDLWGDPILLEQALINVVENAIDATASQRSVIVSIETGTNRESCVYVRDSGPGFSDEVSEQAFDPFFTTKEIGAGTGLGLPIAHEIVTEHGGRLEIVDDPESRGQGACVAFFFPPPADAQE